LIGSVAKILVVAMANALACVAGTGSSAAEVSVAVAANFIVPAQKIAQAFAADTGHSAQLAFGSSGRFYAQIANGAPFEVLLSADDETPLRLEREGLARAGSRYTYAIGRLVLWSRRPTLVDAQGDVLRSGKFAHIALADPKLAPYGAAAMQTIASLGLLGALQPKMVLGENIAQAYQFVASQNADLGFVALSQVSLNGRIEQGSAWRVPQDRHQPILQDAVALTKGKANPAASAFLAYLRGEKARGIIQAHGYDLCDVQQPCRVPNAKTDAKTNPKK
jgi:molybdate transport system substrate-binding protein